MDLEASDDDDTGDEDKKVILKNKVRLQPSPRSPPRKFSLIFYTMQMNLNSSSSIISLNNLFHAAGKDLDVCRRHCSRLSLAKTEPLFRSFAVAILEVIN